MFEINPQQANAYDVYVILRKAVFANDVKNSKLDAWTMAILNIEYASYSRGNYTPKKALRKQRKKMRRPDVRFWIGVSS